MFWIHMIAKNLDAKIPFKTSQRRWGGKKGGKMEQAIEIQ